MRYLEGDFLWHLLPLVPFNWIIHFKNSRLLFCVKIIRLFAAFAVLDVSVFYKSIKESNQRKRNLILQDAEKCEDQINDHNNIVFMIMIKYVMKTVKLIFTIYVLVYFIGLWYIIACELTTEYFHTDDPDDTFFTKNAFEKKNSFEAILAASYFIFTSLATVGFGDLNPRSDFERMMTAFILMFGVAIFSYVMGNFITILNTTKSLNDDLEEGTQLSKFFGLLIRFNKNRPLKEEFKHKLEAYFEYRWSNDNNWAMREDTDLAIYEQLPKDIQRMVFSNFLFQNFYFKFKRDWFTFKNFETKNKNAFYYWHNDIYSSFMIDFFKYLEPYQYHPGDVINGELSDVNRILFVMSGELRIGYTVNHVEYLNILRKAGSTVGAYECTFNRRSVWVYRAKSLMNC